MANFESIVSKILVVNTFIQNQQENLVRKEKLRNFREANKVSNLLAGIPDPYTTSIQKAKSSRQHQLTHLIYPIDLTGNKEYDTYLRFKVEIPTTSKDAKKADVKVGQSNTTEQSDINGVKNFRHHSTIDIYNPSNLNVQYSRQWGEEELGVVTSALFSGDLSAGSAGILSQGKEALNQTIDNLTGLKTQQARLRSQGLAINPVIEVLFKGLNYREFQFQFVFSPRNEQEVVETLAIIKSFKYYSAPEFTQGDPKIKYPSTYEIQFRQNDKQNTNLFKFGKCALTNVEIDYSPNSVWSTFKNGFPVQVNMSLSFQEIELITRSKIGDGF